MQAVAGVETIVGLKTKRMRGQISRRITEKDEKSERTEKEFENFRKKFLTKRRKSDILKKLSLVRDNRA